jgi:hypothetical protein
MTRGLLTSACLGVKAETILETLPRRYGALGDAGNTVYPGGAVLEKAMPVDCGGVLGAVLDVDDKDITRVAPDQGTGEHTVHHKHRPQHAIRACHSFVDDPRVVTLLCGSVAVPVGCQNVVQVQPRTPPCAARPWWPALWTTARTRRAAATSTTRAKSSINEVFQPWPTPRPRLRPRPHRH